MDRWVYLNVLKQYLRTDTAKSSLGEQWIFQHDQYPKDTDHIKEYTTLLSNCIDHPSHSI